MHATTTPNTHLTQTYFPNFLESAIYLRFLNELIHTLKVSGDNSTCADSEAEVKSDLAEGAATAIPDALEDPSSIWRRPAFQYVKLHADGQLHIELSIDAL